MLRYLVEEKGIMYRDISWSNVLIPLEDSTSEEVPSSSVVTGEKSGREYHFISNILGEDR